MSWNLYGLLPGGFGARVRKFDEGIALSRCRQALSILNGVFVTSSQV